MVKSGKATAAALAFSVGLTMTVSLAPSEADAQPSAYRYAQLYCLNHVRGMSDAMGIDLTLDQTRFLYRECMADMAFWFIF
jgi:hypothetical protein